MVAMAYETVPARPAGFTVDDLEEMPNDGRRYELIDGVLVVSPAARPRHQIAAESLGDVLKQACPSHLFVIASPIDVQHGPHTCLQPDTVVVRRADLDLDDAFRKIPVLVVEVVSPNSLDFDLGLKLRAYARLGVPHYWVLHPGDRWVRVHEADGDTYRQVTHVAAAETCEVERPFAVRFRPGDLLAGFEP
jgi:Uma2 family endonuclease